MALINDYNGNFCYGFVEALFSDIFYAIIELR